MREDLSFSNKKLTRAEFSKKYWKCGLVPYQYHTADIEDGRDELEQLLINNCRALREALRSKDDHMRQSLNALCERVEMLENREN
jgi:hypothetical protein